ncbi:MAG: hypothetical protein NC820_06035 [Candidatus Omnitrophica bacterium]|nr:hypothetical protein [Candidatus Omnitrophota bacterium]
MKTINNTIYQGRLNNGQEYGSRAELIRILSDYAVDVRKKIVELTNIAVGAHIGGSLSCVELLIALYFYVLNIKPSNPYWEERDRFILSKGHSALAFFPILAKVGFFPEEKMKTFNQLDSAFGMHPDMHKVPGVEVSTGSLGHGFSIFCEKGIISDRDIERRDVLKSQGNWMKSFDPEKRNMRVKLKFLSAIIFCVHWHSLE